MPSPRRSTERAKPISAGLVKPPTGHPRRRGPITTAILAARINSGLPAWFILSQDDTNGLLHGLPQRLGNGDASSPGVRVRGGKASRGAGGLELDVQVQGEASG